MSDLLLVITCWVFLLMTFAGHFFWHERGFEAEGTSPSPARHEPRRFSGNAHDRRIQRRRLERKRRFKLAPGQTPTRGARGRWGILTDSPGAISYINQA